MKNAALQLVLVLVGVVSVHAVKILKNPPVHIKVVPKDPAKRILAVQGSDSAHTSGIDRDLGDIH